MVTRLVKRVLFFPIRVLSRTYWVITAATSVPDALPVGGLSGERASGLLFALRQVIERDQDVCVAVQWLTSLQLAQIASDRLLHDVDAADGSLSFWSARLKGGAHRSFLLLGRGPTSFVLDCVDFLRGHPRRRLGALKQPNATDQKERRQVILLRALRERLCEALAKADKASLERMLRDFEADFGKASTKVDPEISAALERAGAEDNNATAEGEKASEGKGEEGDELLPGMAFMMSCYEDELKKPIRNIVNGSLLRAILIQVQKLKLDTESAMLELDQILRANELTVAVVAAVPSLLIAGGTCYALFRWLTPSPPDRRSEALPARMAMVEVERTIHKLAQEGTPELQGEVVWRVARVYWETRALYRRHTSGLGIVGLTVQSEWPNLRADLLELVAPNPPRAKIETCHRMQRIYSLFQP
ncbi:hypothetical protein COCSUDRAFT_57806 [Coccomyxa subellipsoidea C-169]|uniref:NCA2-domain-containing protein n=1 Tax=Coccomyxa subellipsoidea (strain C-169) TaxID=574566 RepID=I0YNW5_COCSC|nr:hypothetical protein COCSUDRAFT_57806 [Coccomyxa subellipsoidea C-169]EIE20084.1 hypothetical protein COCSUDRAFT_57806 [Coccomyxa subellipsoidea C-169]|eukprot:XP_005644628.1 hypothetical protein COCSUDRAFT_57806 [Coccomyxa subellipsoidea C-169]